MAKWFVCVCVRLCLRVLSKCSAILIFFLIYDSYLFATVLQGVSLTLIYLTLQAGLVLQAAPPDSTTTAGAASLVILQISSIFLVVSPMLVLLLVGLKIIPKSIRARVSFVLGIDVPQAPIPNGSSSGTLRVVVVRFSFPA